MKATIFSLFFIFTPLFSFSQINQHAISEDGSWIVWNSEPVYGWDNDCQCYIWVGIDTYKYYHTKGDTMIDGSNYKKLYSLNIVKDQITSFVPAWGAPEEYVLAYRNDSSQRAFRIMEGQSGEELWYDFSIQLLDTLHLSPVLPSWANVFTHVDSTEMCDSTYSRYYFNYDAELGLKGRVNLLERAGAMNHFVNFTENTMSFDSLIFFCEDIDSLSQISMDHLLGIPSEGSEWASLTLFPNPAKDFIQIESKNEQIHSSQSFICDISGRVVMYGLALNTRIPVSQLSRGNYFVVIRNDAQVFRLPFIKQ